MKYYTKTSTGRYEEIGERFEGFPADGWWIVADGKQNLVVPIDEPRPLEKLKYLQYHREIVYRLVRNEKAYATSVYELVGNVLNELEEIVREEQPNTPAQNSSTCQ